MGALERSEFCPVLLFSTLCLSCLSPFRYNGSLPSGDRGRRKSRFALYRRAKANGVKPSTVHILNSPQDTKVCVHTFFSMTSVSFLQLHFLL